MAKKTPTEAHDEAKAQQAKADTRYQEDLAESQARVAGELIPCEVCGTTVPRGEVCAVDGHKSGEGEPAL